MDEEREDLLENLAILQRMGVPHTQAQDLWTRAAELRLPVRAWAAAHGTARLIGYNPDTPSPFRIEYGGLVFDYRTVLIGDPE